MKLFLIYETEQVPILAARIAAGEEYTVVALDYEVELELTTQSIMFTSVRDIAISPELQREPIEFTRHLVNAWYIDPTMAFFSHDGILLGEQHEAPLLYHFQSLIYYLVLLKQVIAHYPDTMHVVIPETFKLVPATADPTGIFKERLPVDVARLVAQSVDLVFEVIPLSRAYRAKGTLAGFRGRIVQAVLGIVVRLVNLLVTLFTTPRPIRLLASDPWLRLEPFVHDWDDVELVMTRRKELTTMKGKIWGARARFHHRLDFADTNVRTIARSAALTIENMWAGYGDRPHIASLFEYQGTSFWSVAKPLLNALITQDAENAVITIESSKRLLKHHRISAVLLFASIKGYNNLLARVAERMNIPSIELQHALELTEISYTFARLPARYLAAYGPLTQHHYERFGIPRERIAITGSPRFDQYASPLPESELAEVKKKHAVSPDTVNALVVMPSVYLSLEHQGMSSYLVADILEDLSDVGKRIPNLRYFLKLRPWSLRERFYKRQETRDRFRATTVIAHYEPIKPLLALADFVISGSSTVVLEALIMKKPVIVYLPNPLDHDLEAFVTAGAVRLARTRQELYCETAELAGDSAARVAQVERGTKFLAEAFQFDGHSSKRIKALISEIIDGHRTIGPIEPYPRYTPGT